MKTTVGQTGGEQCWDELLGAASSGYKPPKLGARAELARLTQTIEGEIIPRLMSAFESVRIDYLAADGMQAPLRPPPGVGDVDEFVRLLLTHDAAAAAEYVRALRATETSLQTIYLDLLAPAARRLGEMWEEDRCNFTEVTIGVSRMHQVLLEFSPCFCAHESSEGVGSMTAIIVPLPGEMHNFGLFMVVEFFRRAGWNVWSGTPATDHDLTSMVGRQHFDVVGISASADRHINTMTTRIASIRRESLNRDVYVLVGGQAFVSDPSLVRKVGADGSARDGRQAVELARTLVRAAR